MLQHMLICVQDKCLVEEIIVPLFNRPNIMPVLPYSTTMYVIVVCLRPMLDTSMLTCVGRQGSKNESLRWALMLDFASSIADCCSGVQIGDALVFPAPAPGEAP